jgi:hypothetical protein
MHTRESVCAVAVGDFGEVLLSRVRSIMAFSDGDALWVTLGGRISPGEDLVCALNASSARSSGGQAVRLVEHFFPVRVASRPYSFVGTDNEEVESTHKLRWWQADQILASRRVIGS